MRFGFLFYLCVSYVHLIFAQSIENESFLLVFKEQADLSEIPNTLKKEEKGQLVYKLLNSYARESQNQVVERLDEMGLRYHCFWIANVIEVNAAPDQIQLLKAMEDVVEIVPNTRIKIPEDLIEEGIAVHGRNATELPWGLSMIQADKVWDLGIRGQGVVIGGHDTGVDWTHPALMRRYRGWQNENVDHNYNWHDAIHMISPLNRDSIITDSTNPCGLSISEPCDDAVSSHGTHTIGTTLGYDEEADMTVGVAPEAKWIAVRNMERGYGSLASYLEGFQWFMAPTDIDGNEPDPGKAPHVINNSWACIEEEGCNPENFTVMQTAVENLKKAGIVVVASAGNSGSSGCESITTPAAIYEAVFTVGSTDAADTLSSFSSRGPVTVDGSFRGKPNVVAPGRAVLSSIKGNQYGLLSGTSMSGPHVAGLVALMISANPDLAGRVDEIEEIIERTATKKDSDNKCIYADEIIPDYNFLYGFGRIDALAAVMEAQNATTADRSVFGIKKSWNIYPNPATETFYIDNEYGTGISAINIYDLMGIKMSSLPVNISTRINISVSSWPAGTYLIVIKDDKGRADHARIQVIR